MKLIVALLISFLISLSTFGQGVTYSPFVQPYQVTYVGSGSGSNSTTIIAGSNVTVVTNAANNFTISSSGGGSGIPTLNGNGTNTTIYGGSAQTGFNVNGGLLVDSEQATGNITSLGGLFNGNGGGLSNIFGTNITGLGTNGLTLVNTNFISGQLYTNTTGNPIIVRAGIGLTVAAVVGNAVMSLECLGDITNQVGISTLITSIAMSYTNDLEAVVTNNGTYTFTNRSTGVGNSSAVVAGQICYMSQLVQATGLTLYASNLVSGGTIPVNTVTNASHAILTGGSMASLVQQPSGASAYSPFGFWNTTTSSSIQVNKYRVPYAGILTNFWVSDDTGLGIGTNVVYTIFTNGTACNLNATATGGGTVVPFATSNLLTSVFIPAGTYLHMNISNTCPSLPANQFLNWSIELMR